jgi:hypothetical protein
MSTASKENPSDAARGLGIACFSLSFLVATKTAGQVRAIGRHRMTGADARAFNSVFDPLVFGIHIDPEDGRYRDQRR